VSRNIIEIENLRKSFGEVKAVQDVSFKVKEGELFAFLGINGAGKSTTISIISGTLKKDGGKVLIDGIDIDGGAVNKQSAAESDNWKSTGGNGEKSIKRKKRTEVKEDDPFVKIKREIGIVFQNSVLDKALSVRDNLETRAACYGICGEAFIKRLGELVEMFDLKDILKRPVGKLSGGQRRRVDICRALIAKPKLLILDEPTTGLDPQTRRKIWEILGTLRKKENMTLFLTTHYMEEAAEADFVVIIDGGKVVAKGTPLELKNAYTGDFITIYNASEEAVAALGLPYERIRDAFRVAVKDTKQATELIVANRELFCDYEVIKGNMDDVFLSVTGKKLGN